MGLIDRCRQFIGINTSPEAGTLEGALWLQSFAQTRGLHVELQEESFHDKKQANVFIRPAVENLEPRDGDEFLLQSHFDTINPGPSVLWKETKLNPFQGVIKEGRLYGLGACEPKIDLLCKIEALSQIKEKGPWKLTPVIAANYGGELGMQGLLRALRKNKFRASKALIGEPSGGHLIFAGKGYAAVELEIPFSSEEREYRRSHDLQESVRTQSKIFRGRASHSSGSPHGDNAINKAFEYLGQIPEGVVLMEIEGGLNHNTVADNVVLEFDLVGGVVDPMVGKLKRLYQGLQRIESEFLLIQDRDFQIPHPTLNLGLISTHDDHIRLICSVRTPPLVGEDELQKWFNDLQNISTKVGGHCRMLDFKRPYRTNVHSDFVKQCEDVISSLNRVPKCLAHPACTEMTLLSRLKIECLAFGAGTRKEDAFVSNDSVSLDDLEWSVRFYRTLIEKVCL